MNFVWQISYPLCLWRGGWVNISSKKNLCFFLTIFPFHPVDWCLTWWEWLPASYLFDNNNYRDWYTMITYGTLQHGSRLYHLCYLADYDSSALQLVIVSYEYTQTIWCIFSSPSLPGFELGTPTTIRTKYWCFRPLGYRPSLKSIKE